MILKIRLIVDTFHRNQVDTMNFVIILKSDSYLFRLLKALLCSRGLNWKILDSNPELLDIHPVQQQLDSERDKIIKFCR